VSAAEQQTVSGTEQERLWSVTTLLNMALGSGPGLVYWHCEQTATICIDRRSTLETMERTEAIKWAVDKRWEATERAKARGTEVHRAAEAIALGAPTPLISPELKAEIEPYVQQLVRWLETWKPKFVLAEAPVYNVTYRYAGTCDGVFEIDGRRYLFDYKTTPKGPDARSRPPYSETALQLAAYAHAEEVGVLSQQRYTDRRERYYLYDRTMEHEPMPKVDGAFCIVVSPFDCFAVPVSIGDVPWGTFRHALEVAKWNESGYRDAFGASLIAAKEAT
jgi:hypothetical protein